MSEPSEPWIPTSPSPRTTGESGQKTTGSGGSPVEDTSDSVAENESSSAREGNETALNDDQSAVDHFQNTQIFTGNIDVADERDGKAIGESCLNCGGTIDVSDVAFCPHCGADR